MQGPHPQGPSVRSARKLLGVAAGADPTQIARAYRRLARRLHPDLSLDPDATERFWALQAAYRLALDAARPRGPAATAAPATVAQSRVEHRDTTAVLDSTLTHDGPRRVAWLLAGPVHVQAPHRPTPDAAPSPRQR
jgi:hypothetical protein